MQVVQNYHKILRICSEASPWLCQIIHLFRKLFCSVKVLQLLSHYQEKLFSFTNFQASNYLNKIHTILVCVGLSQCCQWLVISGENSLINQKNSCLFVLCKIRIFLVCRLKTVIYLWVSSRIYSPMLCINKHRTMISSDVS